jgi:hypothetical protein
LEEAIKVQATLDLIPVKHVSWPDKAKKQTPSQVQSSYSGRDSQGGPSERTFQWVASTGGSEGTKEVIFDL